MKKILLLIIVFLTFASPVFAQNKQDQTTNQSIRNIFSISPIIIDTSLQKGEKKQIQYNIGNKLNAPLGIKVTVENFFPTDGQTQVSSNFKNSPMVNWITLSKDNFILEPKQDQNITLSIDTPQNLKDGGYYAVVFFTPFYSKPIDNSSPTVLSKVGSLVLASAGKINYENLKDKVSIQNLSFNLFNEENPIHYSFEVENSYFTHFSAKPFLTIKPLLGSTQRIVLEDKRVLPQTSRLWNENLRTQGLSVLNKATLSVSVGQGNYIYKDFFFVLAPIKEILILALLILIGLIIKFRGKQIKKAAVIMYKG